MVRYDSSLTVIHAKLFVLKIRRKKITLANYIDFLYCSKLLYLTLNKI